MVVSFWVLGSAPYNDLAMSSPVRGLYVIIDPDACAGRDPVEVARLALEGGASMLQWRDKRREKGDQLPQARALRDLCSEHGALLIVNDHVDLALVAGADDRVRASALMSAGAAPVSEYVAAAPDDLRDDVQEVLTPIDPLSRIGEAKGEILVQAGRSDSVVPRAALQALADAAPRGTLLRWYDAEHDLNERARRDQLDWLAARLGVDAR